MGQCPLMTTSSSPPSGMALKSGQTIEGIRNGQPTPIPPASNPTIDPDPKAMDLLAFQKSTHNQLSDTKQACRVQLKLCFHCGQARHVSCGCSNGSRKSQGSAQTPASPTPSTLDGLPRALAFCTPSSA
ncbi:uncharacterized protein VP01_7009g1 [Puccinia sorghi]|uniref:CCHC-type domain-containing protein n=1 Tax=Puccinia sorghi TaxID=27349 RepID=A0A0L6UDU0_9BASI|nr:uncharacterized protein VP01_7009g1 [Puccinia sorghi]